MDAYDITIEHHDRQPADGWCFGHGPAIAREQWPRDQLGLPMCHRLTLRLPEAYRRRGADLPAISIFQGVDEDWLDAKPKMAGMLAYEAHPQDNRMVDVLDTEYAVLWLTEAELSGERTAPPMPFDLEGCPTWMKIGSAAAFAGLDHQPREALRIDKNWQLRQLGAVPELDPAWARALTLGPRVGDPNAGKIPPQGDFFEEETPEGYKLSIWFEGDTVHEPEWGKSLSAAHLGGTMRIEQAHPYPRFSPYFVGLDETLGGFNFGTGTGQLCLETMRIDWACG